MSKKNTFPAIAKALTAEFESDSTLTPQFQAFARQFKATMKAELEKAGATLVDFSRGHFKCSGFYQVGNNVGYFSLPDVRHRVMSNIGGYGEPSHDLLYRTAKAVKNYDAHGQNNWGGFDDPKLAERMVALLS